MKYKLYEVGGRIRDGFLGLQSKDIDYSVVLEDIEKYDNPFEAFVTFIESEGYDIFEKKQSVYTVRSRFPIGHQHEGLTADFVLARKDLRYEENSRVPISTYGSLIDDLERRDFTINAMARGLDGKLIDPFNGLDDLTKGVLKTPLDTALSFTSDPLRILRAMRFAVTKDLYYSDNILDTIRVFNHERMEIVSIERIRTELRKMFRFNTRVALEHLSLLESLNPRLYDTLFKDKLWFEPTLKK